MTFISNNADASFYYREDAAADLARMDTSAMYGNLADAMKNATVWFPSPQVIQIVKISPPCPEDKQLDPMKDHGNDEGKATGDKN
ncbi:MAG: hypothetical protein OXD43_09775 [Bacteroidetes bacterium]|nr:hypothetical protein [Bacteroidota bacterium]